MKVINVPGQFNAKTMYQMISEAIAPDMTPVNKRICLDFNELSFIDPSGVTALSNTIEWLKKRGVTCVFRNAKIHRDAIKFLDDSQFFANFLDGETLSPAASTRSTTLPLCRVSHSESFQWLEMRLMPWLMSKLNMNRSSLSQIDTSLKELFNNIRDHSGEDIGCVFVQHYPKIDQIVFSISDFGVGIPSTISRVRSFRDDGDALLFACQDGTSARSIKTNMGVGLHFLIQNVVGLNGGRLNIHSGHGSVSCYAEDGTERRVVQAPMGFYPGTLVEIRMRTDLIESVDDEREDLEW